ncbi:hypothetical protein IQ238_27470 [Pleurocapsales cyanobacterium LEGE 06147]|nr:hypothetical protein [Pleurocapsales cyanobacterium LEGE 06147]
METNNLFLRLIVLPLIPILFAYLELGGNWFAYRMLARPNLWSISGTVIFSVLYSFVAAVIAKRMNIDLSLLMVNYGFGFAIVSLLIKLDWGKLPQFTNDILKNNPSLWIILFIAALGFFISASFVITSPNDDR